MHLEAHLKKIAESLSPQIISNLQSIKDSKSVHGYFQHDELKTILTMEGKHPKFIIWSAKNCFNLIEFNQLIIHSHVLNDIEDLGFSYDIQERTSGDETSANTNSPLSDYKLIICKK